MTLPSRAAGRFDTHYTAPCPPAACAKVILGHGGFFSKAHPNGVRLSPRSKAALRSFHPNAAAGRPGAAERVLPPLPRILRRSSARQRRNPTGTFAFHPN